MLGKLGSMISTLASFEGPTSEASSTKPKGGVVSHSVESLFDGFAVSKACSLSLAYASGFSTAESSIMACVVALCGVWDTGGSSIETSALESVA